jgi:hypothetical protein
VLVEAHSHSSRGRNTFDGRSGVRNGMIASLYPMEYRDYPTGCFSGKEVIGVSVSASLRKVSQMPPRGGSPPAPTASKFPDASGNAWRTLSPSRPKSAKAS